jgi:transposase-like protein
MDKFAKPGDFCPNPNCPDYGKPQSAKQRNIKKFGKTSKGVQRYRCKTCGKTFTATAGTIFYRKRTSEDEILETLALLAEGVRISSISRAKGHKEDTILSWLRQAASHAAQVEDVLMAKFRVKRGQLDALWAYVKNKGEKGGIRRQREAGSSGDPHTWI